MKPITLKNSQKFCRIIKASDAEKGGCGAIVNANASPEALDAILERGINDMASKDAVRNESASPVVRMRWFLKHPAEANFRFETRP